MPNDLMNVLVARYWIERAEAATGDDARRAYGLAARAYDTTVRETDPRYDTSRGMYAANALGAAIRSGDRALIARLAAEYTRADFVPSPTMAEVIRRMVAKLPAE